MSKITQAETIASKFNPSGVLLGRCDWEDLDQLCGTTAVRQERRNDTDKFTFRDGSAILVEAGCWFRVQAQADEAVTR